MGEKVSDCNEVRHETVIHVGINLPKDTFFLTHAKPKAPARID
jgi:hypothetical protein